MAEPLRGASGLPQGQGRQRAMRAARGRLWAALLLGVVAAAAAEGGGDGSPSGLVTCGSVVKLLNPRHGVRLHSHDVRYGSGSGQQSVTGVTTVDDSNSYWRVRGKTDTVCERGTPVQCGQSIRLTHINTGRNLHSHHFTSPLSGNQEVSAFGEDGEGDFLDDWTVLCGGSYWDRDSEVRFKHSSTDVLLSVTGEQYGRPIHGQREVHGMSYSSQDSYWKAMEGIFMKPSEFLKAEIYHSEL
ncbi:stromal cell-derived factor 2 [Podarcis lilfordi]|uniref:Stromal cell-derived factor 2 n=1 Tax=Podarcis lilfordi TaxID=74358 RepID=A0AA35LDX7_9SAUR|nr:stromal cell-derived factor 2 [Podarcis lilfordi]